MSYFLKILCIALALSACRNETSKQTETVGNQDSQLKQTPNWYKSVDMHEFQAYNRAYVKALNKQPPLKQFRIKEDSTSSENEICAHPLSEEHRLNPDYYNLRAKACLNKNNKVEALENLKLAALYGHHTAQLQLAQWYQAGKDVEVNYRKAYLYYDLYYNQITPKEQQPKHIRNEFQNISDSLLPHLSKTDLKWVDAELDRHNKAVGKWVAKQTEIFQERNQGKLKSP